MDIANVENVPEVVLAGLIEHSRSDAASTTDSVNSDVEQDEGERGVGNDDAIDVIDFAPELDPKHGLILPNSSEESEDDSSSSSDISGTFL